MKQLMTLMSILIVLLMLAGVALADPTVLVYKGKSKMVGNAVEPGTSGGVDTGFTGTTSGTVYLLMTYDDTLGTVGETYHVEYWSIPLEPTRGAYYPVYNLEVFFGPKLGLTPSTKLNATIFSFDLNDVAGNPGADMETLVIQGKLVTKETGNGVFTYPGSLKGYGTGMRTMNYQGTDYDVVAAGPLTLKLDKKWTLQANTDGIGPTLTALIAALTAQGVQFPEI